MSLPLPWVGIALLALLTTAVPAVVEVDDSATLLAATAVMAPLRRRRGRPRKFDEPTRVVSLTLPEAVIAALTNLHADLGHAVAKLTRKTVKSAAADRRPAELVTFGRRAVISVRPSRTLEARLGIEMVPLADGRALIAFDAPHSTADFELRLHDALEDACLPDQDRETLESIRTILRDARRSEDVALIPRNIIVLEAVPTARRKTTRGASDAS